MDLRSVLTALRVSWWLPALGALLGGVAVLAVTLLTPPLYTAETQLFVAATHGTSSSDAFQGSQFSQQRVASYAQLVAGDKLLLRVIERLDLDLTVDELAREITATAVPNTVLLDVSVTDPSPERAQQIATEVGATFAHLVAQLESPAGSGPSPVTVTVVDAAEVPADASEPRTARNVAIALGAGLLLGGAAAIARAALDRSVRDAAELTEQTGIPVIGTILRDDDLAKGQVITSVRRARVAEEYRQLLTNLAFLDVDNPPRVLMVSSAVPSEGKTTVTINLAVALAESGRRVTLIEADLRRPRVTRYLGLVGGVGLTNVLAGTAELEDIAQAYGDGLLSVIGAGQSAPNPGNLLASSQMRALLEKLRGEGGIVLIDSPPLLPVADAMGLAPSVDGVVLTVRYGSTRKEHVQQAVAALDRVGARTLGIVLSLVPPKDAGASAYAYDYDDERVGSGSPDR